MISYCLKQKKYTNCLPDSESLVKAKDGRLMMKCTCAECGMTKKQFIKQPRKVALRMWRNEHNKQEILDKTKEGNSYENVNVEP